MSSEPISLIGSQEIEVPRFGAPEEAMSNSLLRRRKRVERIFRGCGLGAIAVSLLALCVLLASIAVSGWGALWEPILTLDIHYDVARINPDDLEIGEALREANYTTLVTAALQEHVSDATGRRQRRKLKRLVSSAAGYELRDRILSDPSLLGTTVQIEVPLSDDAGRWFKGEISLDQPESQRPLDDAQLAWLTALRNGGMISSQINWRFLSSGDSREPELAGVRGAMIGSLLTLIVTLACSFPIGVGAAVYLEEFARKGKLSDFIEININNLAAVPSVVFGLLGLSIFLNVFELPRSAPLVGGLVLSLMTLPTIIISTRSALKAVPPTIRDAAMALGASPVQVVAHHLLPLAIPGIMTGTIIGMARALGETAPLLMIGMVAFVADIPEHFSSPSTVLPVQIYLWSDSPQRGFEEKTSAAILVLLGFLILMNAAAIVIRRRFERRW
jgi:phosphate transport system permease protein